MKRRTWLAALAVLVVGAGWYLFRPERLVVNQKVNESFPAVGAQPGASTGGSSFAAPEAVAAGRFHDGAHKTSGLATIYRLPGGGRTLRLTSFETSNGPEVQVYLGAAADATDNATVTTAGFVSLGAMKGNVGDQNYDIPASVDLSKYRSVTIWCRRFGVNFGTAPLTPAAGTAAPAAVVSGIFHGVAHETRGTVTIYEVAGGRHVLRLSNFETSNGPDVQVYLGAAADARDNETVTRSGFVTVGALKGNVGDQNYVLPSGVDLAKYHSVTIWCHRFGVNFGTAPLGGETAAAPASGPSGIRG